MGVHVRVATLLTRAVLRTRTTSDTAGFMKALIADDDRIVGFAMIGSDAGEVMAAVQVAMMAQLALHGHQGRHPHPSDHGGRLEQPVRQPAERETRLNTDPQEGHMAATTIFNE